jgi:Cupin-like domain
VYHDLEIRANPAPAASLSVSSGATDFLSHGFDSPGLIQSFINGRLAMSALQELSAVNSTGNAAIVPVPRINARDLPYRQFIRDFVAKNRPVVIVDATTDWAALATWTPEYFKSKYGSQTVEVTYGVHRQIADVMDGVMASTAEKPGPYLHKVIIHQHMPSLLPDLQPENIYSFPMRYCSPLMPRRFRRPDGYLKLLIGGVGGKFPLMHFDSDNSHATITEIYGDKEFVLFAPEDTACIYPHADSPSTSQIDDLDHVDLSEFPDFPKATQYRAIISPGETIFVPSRWWHSARVVTTSVSVCTNSMYATNWAGFVKLSCDSANGTPAKLAKRIYLGFVGAVMSFAEKLQDRFPGSGLIRFLGHLSPATPAARRQ